MTDSRDRIQIIVPVHNEGATIGRTLMEWYQTLTGVVTPEFIVAEDGSTDNTRDVLRDLNHTLPLRLILSEQRRGYAGAVIAAFRSTDSPWVLAIDGDGQCDPLDFQRLYAERSDADIVIGWRVNRRDSVFRKLYSRAFKTLYRRLFTVTVHDPSCPYVLFRRDVFSALLPDLGTMPEGFWWEFIAAASRAGFRMKEVPVTHRRRAGGQTVVFTPSAILFIAVRNIRSLIRLKQKLG